MNARAEELTGWFGGMIRRPVTLIVLFVSIAVIGIIAYRNIPLQMMPNGMSNPALFISALNPGASAKENEQKVARPLEEEIRTLAGIEDISSTSRDDFVSVQVEFNSRIAMDLAKAEVRDRIERARPKLPTTVRQVELFSFSESDFPVMFCALLHPEESEETDALIDEVIQRRLESVHGVGKVEISGVLDDSIRILLDENRVRAVNLDLGKLIARLSADNFARPMGEVTDGGTRVMLRSDMRFKSPAEIGEYPIGGGLKIKDVGRVIKAKSVRDRLFRMDGSYSYYLEIRKEAQANVVDTCARLHDAFDELEANPRLKGKFKFLPLFDQGEFISSSLRQLTETAYLGGLFAVIVIFVFLWRIRLTIAVALSIPISVLFAIAWQYFGGGSFNVLTMMGVTLATGMLVDDAIVVIENIVRLKHLGLSDRAAAAAGAREVALAVLLSTLTVVVVFMPLIFMTSSPQMRIIFGELGSPLCTSLMCSLAVALIFLPVIAARILGDRPQWFDRITARLRPIGEAPARAVHLAASAIGWSARALVRLIFALERGLLSVIAPMRWLLALAIVGWIAWRWIASEPSVELAGKLSAISGSAASPALAAGRTQLVFLGVVALALLYYSGHWKARRNVAPVRAAANGARSNSVIELLMNLNERLVRWTISHRFAASFCAILAFFSFLIPSSHMTLAGFGEDDNHSRIGLRVDLEDNFNLEQAEHELVAYEQFLETHRADWGFNHLSNRFDRHGGRISMYWEKSLPPETQERLQRALLAEAPKLPGHKIKLWGSDGSESKNKNVVEFQLRGPDSDELERIGERATKILAGIDGLKGIGTSRDQTSREVRVHFDSDRAQSFGLSPTAAFQNISWALRGWQLPRYQEPGREIPLIIEYDNEEIEGLQTLREMNVMSVASSVPLSSFSELEFAKSSPTIERHNGQTTFTLQARIASTLDQPRLSEAGYSALKRDLDLPHGYSIGEDNSVGARAETELNEVKSALLFAFVLVFLVMGILFESFLLPISVVITIFYAPVGALWALYFTGVTLDSIGWIGMVILVGVVAKNGIVLIDRIHQLREAGYERSAAVIEGTKNRVRPVAMTAMTTVFALVPTIVAAPPAQGIDYRALATCVVGGVTVNTFFSLWVIPLAYTLLDDLAAALMARTRWAMRRPKFLAPKAEPVSSP